MPPTIALVLVAFKMVKQPASLVSKKTILKRTKPVATTEISAKGNIRGKNRKALEDRWYALMRQELPGAARAEGGWPIQLDHCFMRVALDNYFGKCWYEVLDKQKGAVKSMSDSQLSGAIKVAEGMLQRGRDAVVGLNEASLRFRGKAGPKGRATQ